MKYFQDRFFVLDRIIEGLRNFVEKFTNKNFLGVPNVFLFLLIIFKQFYWYHPVALEILKQYIYNLILYK